MGLDRPEICDVDLGWISGFLDGEGYFSIYARASAGKNKGYDHKPRALVRVNQAGTREPLDKLKSLLGGSIFEARRRTVKGKRVWGWQWQSAAAMRQYLPLFTPNMTTKRKEAQLVLQFVKRARRQKRPLVSANDQERTRRAGNDSQKTSTTKKGSAVDIGLDMYLSRTSYVKNWNFHAPEQRHSVVVSRGGQPRSDINPKNVSYVVEEVARWRKANAVHKWFVEHCQGGEDDCREAKVSRHQLQELVDLCRQVLATVETVDGDVKIGTTYYPDGTVVQNTEPGQLVAQTAIAEKLLPTQGGFFFGNTDYDRYYLDDLRSTIEQLEPVLAIENDEGEYKYRASW